MKVVVYAASNGIPSKYLVKKVLVLLHKMASSRREPLKHGTLNSNQTWTNFSRDKTGQISKQNTISEN